MTVRARATDRPFLFRWGASVSEKVFTVLLLLWMISGPIAYYRPFVPSDSMKKLSIYLAIASGLLLTAIIMRTGYLLRKPPQTLMQYLVTGTLVGGLMVTVSFFAWAWGGGLVGTLISGEKRSSQYKILAKSDGSFRRRDCDYQVSIVDAQAQRLRVCIGKTMWDYVRIGDTVRSVDLHSWFGTYFSEYERQR